MTTATPKHREGQPIWLEAFAVTGVQRRLLKSILVGLFYLVCASYGPAVANAQAAENRPNVIVILTDDQGWGDLSFHGNTNLSTPNIDHLAQQGSRFDRFYVCPVCSPTRAEFLTGRYHPRGGVHDTSKGGERLDLDERTLAQHFQAAGYRTAAFGKWHNGMQYPYHPRGRGFDEFYGYCSGHWGNYFSPMLEHNGELVRGEGYIVDDFTDHAIDFIEQSADQPFFLYLPMPTPHSPMQVPDAFWESHQDQTLERKGAEKDANDLNFTRAALAMVECIDLNVGRLLDRVDQLKIADNTIVVFFCDNGPNNYRWNGGMRGRKGSTDEGGVRSPMFIRWPEKIPAGKEIRQIAGAIDLLPTLTDLAEVPVQGGHPLDGVSLKESLLREEAVPDDRLIFSHWNRRVSVRTQQYRLDHQGRLYDMHSDPEQTVDVATEHPELTERLKNEVKQWSGELLPGLKDDTRPFPIGHPDFPVTQLPARDGQPHGNVMRSARAPNCSYFTNWNAPEDSMTWSVDVLKGGRFEVEMYYACPPADVGAEIQLCLGDVCITKQVDEANDPPATGLENDRADRGSESFVKEFKPLNLGVLEIPAGTGELTLSASHGGAKTNLEMRLFMFRRVAE
ncbi:arylsulfatase [Aureliella helgolandensis]|uniref:arylsulfatase n=1 Tax=Aureliella helgolandensis TaxID=2527968 RepID=UPI0018D115B6|nr:arylsulfatase [Aureliella helgolandensis]